MATTLSRCVAVAAHGRRCQQSRYKGSPYCWHHMQSRKVPATSRIVPMRPRAVATDDPGAGEASRHDPRAIELGARLVDALGRDTADQVLRAMESGADASVTLIRHAGGVAVWQSPRRLREARAGW